jgi:hypothetical protein
MRNDDRTGKGKEWKRYTEEENRRQMYERDKGRVKEEEG